ncbi:MAG: DMT family transporter [Pseudomonadota bacterium]
MTAKPPDNRLGLWYMLIGMCLFATTDALAKLLTQSLPPLQIVWLRQTGLFSVVIVLYLWHGPSLLRSSQPGLQLGRGVLAAISASLFIVAIAYVPLADAVAITFVAPFIVTVLGAWLLGEAVGPRRWTAVVVGFVGTLIVIRPGFGVVHPAAMLLVVAAAAFAGRQILSRMLARGDPTRTTIAYTAIVSWTLLALPIPFVWQNPTTTQEVLLLVAIALLAAAGETFVIMALDAAEAVVVAPVQYVLLVWGTLYGFLLFGQLPDGWTWLGAAMIVLTGLYIFHRERQIARVVDAPL